MSSHPEGRHDPNDLIQGGISVHKSPSEIPSRIDGAETGHLPSAFDATSNIWSGEIQHHPGQRSELSGGIVGYQQAATSTESRSTRIDFDPAFIEVERVGSTPAERASKVPDSQGPTVELSNTERPGLSQPDKTISDNSIESRPLFYPSVAAGVEAFAIGIFRTLVLELADSPFAMMAPHYEDWKTDVEPEFKEFVDNAHRAALDRNETIATVAGAAGTLLPDAIPSPSSMTRATAKAPAAVATAVATGAAIADKVITQAAKKTKKVVDIPTSPKKMRRRLSKGKGRTYLGRDGIRYYKGVPQPGLRGPRKMPKLGDKDPDFITPQASFFDSKLPYTKRGSVTKDKPQFREAMKDLKKEWKGDPLFKERFTREEQKSLLDAFGDMSKVGVKSGTAKGFTWHHSTDAFGSGRGDTGGGVLQLLDYDLHKANVPHFGGRFLTGGPR